MGEMLRTMGAATSNMDTFSEVTLHFPVIWVWINSRPQEDSTVLHM